MVRLNRQIFASFDWTLLLLVLAICTFGVLNIYSTGYSPDAVKQTGLYLKQLQWILLGLFFMVAVFLIDYRLVNEYAYALHGTVMFLLIVVAFYGYATHGSQRWIAFGGFSFQPSELAKITLILALARFFNDHRSPDRYSFKGLLVPFGLMAAPFVLILRQPDLGTALILMILFGSIVLFVGISWRDLLVSVVAAALVIPASWPFLRPYQKGRILTFFNPERDPLGSGYHIIQSMIAVGSGGFFGKGYLKGTQTQLKFLPEQQTDFVFSAFAEEWGFIGGSVIIALFLLLVLWGLKVALHSRDYLGAVVAFGISMLFFWGAFINMGMVLGLLPVVGVPLPFMSYGGSSMMTLMIGVGLLMNISRRRYLLQS